MVDLTIYMMAIGTPIRKMYLDSASIVGNRPRIEEIRTPEKAILLSMEANLNVNKEYKALYSSSTIEAFSCGVSDITGGYLKVNGARVKTQQ